MTRWLERLFKVFWLGRLEAEMAELRRVAICPVPGLNLNEDGSRWHDAVDAKRAGAPFPHCDDQVLHRPGSCEFCDDYPRSQAARLWMRVAFTNDPAPHPQGFMPCPSLSRRSREDIERWSGNRPARQTA